MNLEAEVQLTPLTHEKIHGLRHEFPRIGCLHEDFKIVRGFGGTVDPGSRLISVKRIVHARVM